jgi:pyruvate dehydrogenase E1 component alpha subunit
MKAEETMQPDLWSLYTLMLRSRLFEESVAALWKQGLISGEMHLGTGEEAVAAGVVDHLRDGDAMALDHRGTPPLMMRGVDPVLLLREFLGRPDGLCSGMGGHMHLFSPQHLAASSGIVGSSGPAAVGFALAAVHLRPDSLCVAFFGEGAMNQGMMLEAMNLAVAWTLPVLFVCKDNEWAVTTRSSSVTGGSLSDRAGGLGMPTADVDGCDVEAVWHAAQGAVTRARNGEGPTFLHARCIHLEGHFLGDPLLRAARQPAAEMTKVVGPLLRSASKGKGAPIRERLDNLRMIGTLSAAVQDQVSKAHDPLDRARRMLETDERRLKELEEAVANDIRFTVEKALGST